MQRKYTIKLAENVSETHRHNLNKIKQKKTPKSSQLKKEFVYICDLEKY